jgi:hypothetical protein
MDAAERAGEITVRQVSDAARYAGGMQTLELTAG